MEVCDIVQEHWTEAGIKTIPKKKKCKKAKWLSEEALQIAEKKKSERQRRKGIHLPMQETWVPSLGREDPLEKEMANCVFYSNIYNM